MDNQRYISIVRLLQHCDVAIEEPLNLSRVRKQVLAEFASSIDGFVHLDTYTYNKSDVLFELDKIDFLERWPMHLIVWNNKQILNILEDEFVNMDTIGQEMNVYIKDENFIDFFSPYFKTCFKNMSRSLLHPPQLDTLAIFMKTKILLMPYDEAEAFSSIEKYFLEQERVLRNTTIDNYKSNREEMKMWRVDNWQNVLNMLPDNYYHLKETLVIRLINLSVELQKRYSSDCKLLSAKMVKLVNIDPEHKNLIASNHRVFIGQGESSGTNYWWVIWVVILIARALAQGGC